MRLPGFLASVFPLALTPSRFPGSRELAVSVFIFPERVVIGKNRLQTVALGFRVCGIIL